MHDTLIVAIGNTVMTDDAVGFHVLQELLKMNIKADFAFLGQDIFKLRQFFKKHKRVIILDAILNGYPIGSVICFDESKIREELQAKTRSAHFIGSIEALEIMKLANDDFANAEIFFIGIVVESVDKGLELTKKVTQAIPKAIESVINLL